MSFIPRANNKLTRAPVLNLSKPRDKRPLTVIDREGLVAAWQQQAFAALDEMELRQREGTLTPRDGKDLAIKGGICTEKALLAAGQPTEVIGHVSAHRRELGPLLDRLVIALGPVASRQLGYVKSTRLPSQVDASLTSDNAEHDSVTTR